MRFWIQDCRTDVSIENVDKYEVKVYNLETIYSIVQIDLGTEDSKGPNLMNNLISVSQATLCQSK